MKTAILSILILVFTTAGSAFGAPSKRISAAKSASKKMVVNASPEVRASVAPQPKDSWVRLRIYTGAEVVSEQSVPAFLVSPHVLAGRLSTQTSFQDLVKSRSICYPSASRCSPLTVLQMDLQTRWVWFQSSQKIATTARMPTQFSANMARVFGYGDSQQMNASWRQLQSRDTKVRQLASGPTSVSGVGITKLLQSEIMNWAGQVYQGFMKARVRFTLGGMTYSGLPSFMSCKSASPQVKDESLQRLIYGGDATECGTEQPVSFSDGFQNKMSMRFGFVDLWSNRTLSGEQRTQMLEEIGQVETRNLKDQSYHVQESTHATCSKSFLRDESVEVQYCTRTLRQFPELQDTVLVIGKHRAQRFFYNVVRLSGFNAEYTKKLTESFVTKMGENP